MNVNINKGLLLGVLGIFGCAVVWNVIGLVTLSMQREAVRGDVGRVWTITERAIELLPRLENDVEVFMKDRQDLVELITIARNDFLAAEKSGNLDQLSGVIDAVMAIQVQIEAYPEVNLTQQQVALMDETAGSINRISFARDTLIESQVGFNQSRIIFFPVGLMFPRMSVLGEYHDPSTPLPTSNFGG